jgi:hypothetical protein
MVGKMIKPRGLAKVFQAVPAREIVKFRESSPVEQGLFVGQISSHKAAEAGACLRQGDLIEIAHHICTVGISGMAGELTTKS